MTLINQPLHQQWYRCTFQWYRWKKTGAVALFNGTVGKKTGAVFLLILADPKPLFSVTHHPLHPFLAPKSPVVQY